MIDTRKLGLICYSILIGFAYIIKPDVIFESSTTLGAFLAPVAGIIGLDVKKHWNDKLKTT